MSMKIERAIEILDPAGTVTCRPGEWIQAHRMACQALALLWWKDAAKVKPEPGEFVLGVCKANLTDVVGYDNEIVIVEYDERSDTWLLESWPEVKDVTVSHWMRLPMLPEVVET